MEESHFYDTKDAHCLHVLVIGGGPSGLLFATSLKSLLKSSCRISVSESRWKVLDNNVVVWKGLEENINRREQVVTLQSKVCSVLPENVFNALFTKDNFSCVWPTGGDSPQSTGFPKNIRIMDIEDNLLKLAREMDINLLAKKVIPNEIDLSEWNIIVFADGGSSKNREYFLSQFGNSDRTPYSLSENHLTDTVLALRVTSKMSDPNTVVLTVAQNRFLFNGINGDGYLYMRLTEKEASEVKGRRVDGTIAPDCIQSRPCMMKIDSSESLTCPTHRTTFLPPNDEHSVLWPQAKEGLKLFQCELLSVTSFRLNMVSRSRFISELTSTGSIKPVFGALIGDAANTIHFWPGRGLNHAILSAVGLARCLHRRWNENSLRSSDFTKYVAMMSALQHRHKDRAWRQVVIQKEGKTKSISEIIHDALQTHSGRDKEELVGILSKRVEKWDMALRSRLVQLPNVEEVITLLHQCDVKTLNAMVESQNWETRLSGGAEVDLDDYLPPFERHNELRRRKEKEKEKEELNNEFSVGDSVTSMSVSSDMYSVDEFTDILSEESIRKSFELATKFSRRNSLSLDEAVREARALLIRADKGKDITEDKVHDIVHLADTSDHFRIDVDEFLSAMRSLKNLTEPKRCNLGEVWASRFQDSAGVSGRMKSKTAQLLLMDIAESVGGIRNEKFQKSENILRAFQQRAIHHNNQVDVQIFLDVAADCMTSAC